MTGVLELVKWGTVGAGEVNGPGLLVTAGWITVLWVFGLWFFSRAETASVDRM
jgi:hypothetical protein